LTSRRQTESSALYCAVCNLGDGVGIEHRGIYSFIDAHLARLRKLFGLKWHRPTTRSTSFSISCNEAFVEPAFRRIAPIIWTVSAIAIASGRQSVGGDASAQAARKKLFVPAIRRP
jgi:hypothetical protein